MHNANECCTTVTRSYANGAFSPAKHAHTSALTCKRESKVGRCQIVEMSSDVCQSHEVLLDRLISEIGASRLSTTRHAFYMTDPLEFFTDTEIFHH